MGNLAEFPAYRNPPIDLNGAALKTLDGDTGPQRKVTMSHKHQNTLNKLFAHPIEMNIAWRDVLNLLESLGGKLDHTKHGQMKVKLNGTEKTFGIPHHEHTIKSRHEVVSLRNFIEIAGFAPTPKVFENRRLTTDTATAAKSASAS